MPKIRMRPTTSEIFQLLFVKAVCSATACWNRLQISRNVDQIRRQELLFSAANIALKGNFETIAFAPA